MKAFLMAALFVISSVSFACPIKNYKACGLSQCGGNFYNVAKAKSNESTKAVATQADGTSNRQH